jgi:hypothetical protein
MLWFLIGLGYFLVALVVACFGAFGIAVTKWDRHGMAYQKMPGSWHPEEIYQNYLGRALTDDFFQKELEGGANYQNYQYRYDRVSLLWLTVVVSLFWPVGLPLYFATKRGHMIADELARRDAA